MTNTCLFTGELLPNDTTIEHPIPYALGGRLKSKEIVSSAINKKSGDMLDNHLVGAFSMILSVLAPLMPKIRGSGKNVVYDKESGTKTYYLPGGKPRLSAVVKEYDDETGELKSIRAQTAENGRRILKEMGYDEEKFKYETVQAPPVVKTEQGFCWQVELGALKAVLLSFDYLLRDSSNRFTRTEALRPIIGKISDALQENNPSLSCSDVVSGIDYKLKPSIDDFRKRWCKEARTEFEHIMIVSGDTARRSISAVWSILGFEPHKFVLSRDWHGDSFTYLFVNGILKKTSASGLCPSNDYFDIRPKTKYSTYYEEGEDLKEYEAILEDIHNHRIEAWRKAIYLIEQESDDILVDRIEQMALVKSPEVLVVDGVQALLELHYQYALSNKDKKTEFDEVVSDELRKISSKARRQSFRDGGDYSHFLKLYRAITRKLRDDVGYPGSMSSQDRKIKLILKQK